MKFDIKHITSYSYATPAAEGYAEARLTPPSLPTQRILQHRIECHPPTKMSGYEDFFGNDVQFFSLPYRHRKLTITNRALVETQEIERRHEALSLSVEESRQIFSSAMPDVFPYLQETEMVELGREAVRIVRRFFRGDTSLGEGIERLSYWIHDTFTYTKDATDNATNMETLWRTQKGVCQDYAHIALSVLRTAGLPSRYVCGYIDSGGDGEAGMVGALATHAWVDILLPGMTWVGIDPTNRKWVNDQYIAVSYGRDFRDATPLRGTFKGAGAQVMKVKVYVKRKEAAREGVGTLRS